MHLDAMMKILALTIAALCAFIASACAQIGGGVTESGGITIGHVAIFGPGPGQIQDGGSAPGGAITIGSTTCTIGGTCGASSGAPINGLFTSGMTDTGIISAGGINFTGTAMPTNGFNLQATNQIGLYVGGSNRAAVQTTEIISSATSGFAILFGTATATLPVFIQNRSDTKAGLGADIAGDDSIITDNAGTATEAMRFTGTGTQIFGVPTISKVCTMSVLGAVLTFTNGQLTASTGC